MRDFRFLRGGLRSGPSAHGTYGRVAGFSRESRREPDRGLRVLRLSERILQPRQRLEIRAVALARVRRRKELSGVAKLLCGNPHGMPFLGCSAFQRRAALEQPRVTMGEQWSRKFFPRFDWVPLRITAFRAECADRQHHALEPGRSNRVASYLSCGAPMSADASAQSREILARDGILSERSRQRRQRLLREHVPAARGPPNRGKPAHLLHERCDAILSANGFQQREARTQPPRADAHLVYPFR